MSRINTNPLIIAIVAGTLRDVTGNWDSSFYFCSTALFFASVVMLIRQFSSRRGKDLHVDVNE